MNELRKDYILDRYVIIAGDRGKRPHQFKSEKIDEDAGLDYFAPGNEDKTPKEIDRVSGEDGNWKIRVFPNKFAAAKPEGVSTLSTDNEFYTFANAYGYHEILVETPDMRQLWDLSHEEVFDVLSMLKKRFLDLSYKEGIKYVATFKNHKKAAGTSILHSHFQTIAYNIVPTIVKEKIAAIKRIGGDPYNKIINSERDSDRRCFENDRFIAFCPYASRFNLEVLILPKEFSGDIAGVDLNDLSDILVKVLGRLKELNCAFNLVFFYSPTPSDGLRFHIEVLPRISVWAGFEMHGTIINTMPPEVAAKFYRGED